MRKVWGGAKPFVLNSAHLRHEHGRKSSCVGPWSRELSAGLGSKGSGNTEETSIRAFRFPEVGGQY